MVAPRAKLYAFILTTCLVGHLWLFYNLMKSTAENHTSVCLIKNITGVACPSCGTTRAAVALIQGDLVQSMEINPLGLLVVSIMFLAPIWIGVDFLFLKKTFYEAYLKVEIVLEKPLIAAPLISFVILNWIWNIVKGL